KTQGGRQILVRPMNGVAKSFLSGPRGEGGREISVPLEIRIDEENKSARLSWPGGEQGLTVGQWSPWVRVTFAVNDAASVTGMTRFYLKSLSPNFSLYASAFNFTPDAPVFPISYPEGYAKRLKDSIGDFHTLGMPHDTWALNEGAMSDEMFLEQSRTVLDEEIKMLEHELPNFKEGLFVFVVETPDRVQHMFWRAVDPAHPLYTAEFAQKYGGVIEDAYRQMDEILGLVLNHVDDGTFLMVVSDHGFKSFRRAVHLNSWLRDNGFLIYKEGAGQKTGDEFFKDVDWSRSKAYAVGLGSVYLNLKGREKEGIVEPGAEADAVKREIARKLKDLKDAKTGVGAVRAVHLGEEIFSGEAIAEAPDLLVGFEDGYRASWQTALGAAPADEIEDNLKKWSGDHIIDPTLVPGVFFSNRKVDVANPSLYDMSPTVLSLFGIEVPVNQTGRDLFHMQEATR
ncbi:MAG: alkaline phosphatase family protein, partial [Candidatus Omnitrophota bacterium]